MTITENMFFEIAMVNGIETSLDLSVEETPDGKKSAIFYNNEKQNELDLCFIIKRGLDIHVRNQIIELFENEEKIEEVEIVSKQLAWATAENSKLTIRLSGNSISSSIVWRDKNFLIEGNRVPFDMEKVFKSHNDVRYHFIEAKDPKFSNKLIVVFSAISPKYTFNYNYLSTLNAYPVNQLYILDDFNDQGTYYLGKQRDHVIESSVVSLILHFASKLNITLNDITSIGSSKGGYSALYYGIKYSFGDVISLAPQTKLGNFLRDEYRSITEYVSKGNDEGDIYYLNELLYRLVRENRESLPYIQLMVGTKDSHKDRHVLPFSKHLNQLNINHKLDIIEGVDHTELKFVAPDYIKNQLTKKFYNEEIPEIYISNISFNQNGDILTVETKAKGSGITFAHYWYRNNELIQKDPYKKSNEANFSVTSPGRYRVRIFVKNDTGGIITQTSRSIDVNGNQ